MIIPSLEKFECDVEDASDSVVVQVYDPQPSRAYVRLLEDELARTREALTQAL